MLNLSLAPVLFDFRNSQLIAIAIILVPVLLAVINARRYNFLFGLFSFLFFSEVLVVVAAHVGVLNDMLEVNGYLFHDLYIKMLAFIHGNLLERLSFIKNLAWKEWLHLAVWGVLFLILWLIAAKMRNGRKERMFNKYSNLKKENPRY